MWHTCTGLPKQFQHFFLLSIFICSFVASKKQVDVVDTVLEHEAEAPTSGLDMLRDSLTRRLAGPDEVANDLRGFLVELLEAIRYVE